MSLSRKTYSPMSHTYSYSTTLSPSYSYSRVTTYLDALERDDQINKLKRQLTCAKSLQMKYYSLLQEISMAEKQNRLLETKNTNIQQEYVTKIQQTRQQTSQLQEQLQNINKRLNQEETKVECVQKQIQELLQQLKQLKLQQENINEQNNQLESEIHSCTTHLTKLNQQQQSLSTQKVTLCADSKQSTTQMQTTLKTFTQLTQMINKYTQQLQLLKSQSQCFQLQCKNMEKLCEKNSVLIQNLQRKVTIQQGQNQQIKNQLNAAQQQWQTMQTKFMNDKQSLYQNVIKVQQCGLQLKQCIGELDKLLETDSTQKKYLKDVSTKQALLTGQNDQMRQLVKDLQDKYNEKKSEQTSLIQELNKRIKNDEMLKQTIQQRSQQLNKLKCKYSSN